MRGIRAAWSVSFPGDMNRVALRTSLFDDASPKRANRRNPMRAGFARLHHRIGGHSTESVDGDVGQGHEFAKSLPAQGLSRGVSGSRQHRRNGEQVGAYPVSMTHLMRIVTCRRNQEFRS